MANEFAALIVVFAAVAQVSIAAELNLTLEVWNKAVDVLFYAIEHPSSDINSAKFQYLGLVKAGAQAFVTATPGSLNNKEALLNKVAARYKNVTDLLFDAIARARNATAANFNTINGGIYNSLNLIPVKKDVEEYFTLARSNASQDRAVDDLEKVFSLFFAAIKSLAETKAGKETSTDTSLCRSAAHCAISDFTNAIYGALTKQG